MLLLKLRKSKGRRCLRFRGSLDNIYSVGTNNLIKNGAKLVTGPVDILKNYPELLNKKIEFEKRKNVKEEFKGIYEALLFDKYLSLDEIITKTGSTTRDVITKITLMELEGIIEQKTGKGYRKIQ